MEAEEELDDEVVDVRRVLDAGNERRQTALAGVGHRIGARHVQRAEHGRLQRQDRPHVVQQLHRQLETVG